MYVEVQNHALSLAERSGAGKEKKKTTTSTTKNASFALVSVEVQGKGMVDADGNSLGSRKLVAFHEEGDYDGGGDGGSSGGGGGSTRGAVLLTQWGGDVEKEEEGEQEGDDDDDDDDYSSVDVAIITERVGAAISVLRRKFQEHCTAASAGFVEEGEEQEGGGGGGGQRLLTYAGALAALLELEVNDEDAQKALRAKNFSLQQRQSVCTAGGNSDGGLMGFSQFLQLYASANTGLDVEPAAVSKRSSSATGGERGGGGGGKENMWVEGPHAKWSTVTPSDVSALKSVYRRFVVGAAAAAAAAAASPSSSSISAGGLTLEPLLLASNLPKALSVALGANSSTSSFLSRAVHAYVERRQSQGALERSRSSVDDGGGGGGGGGEGGSGAVWIVFHEFVRAYFHCGGSLPVPNKMNHLMAAPTPDNTTAAATAYSASSSSSFGESCSGGGGASGSGGVDDAPSALEVGHGRGKQFRFGGGVSTTQQQHAGGRMEEGEEEEGEEPDTGGGEMSPRLAREVRLEQELRARRQQHRSAASGVVAERGGGERGGGNMNGSSSNNNGGGGEVVASLQRAFRRLDPSGEGRITVLSLKAAQEEEEEYGGGRHNNNAPPAAVAVGGEWELRRWVQERDRARKGFVDFSDFVAFYELTGHGLTPPTSEDDGDVDGGGGGGGEGYPHQRHGHEEQGYGAPEESPFEAKARQERAIRQAFDAYDLNGDGVITYLELRTVFARSGRQVSELELREWIRTRDRTNRGSGVTFSDFRAAFLERM
jgi:Ca2+-binding EF-hand superfamily protein